MTNMRELGLPVRKWVPNWLALISIFIIILPITMLNGSYTGSMLEVSNTLGTNTEDITMGYYAASAGMAIAYPIVPKVLSAFSVKFLLLADLALQFILSWICARSQSADILIVASFAIGFLKGFLMLWFIRHAQKIFSPKNVRSEFYSYFYPLVYGSGQISMVLTAELAYHYNWKYMYYFMMLLLLLAILLVIVCYRHNRPLQKISHRRIASAGDVRNRYRSADADVCHQLRKNTRLDVILQNLRLHCHSTDSDSFFCLDAISFRNSLCQSGSLIFSLKL